MTASAPAVQRVLAMLSEAKFIDYHTGKLSGRLVTFNNPTESFAVATFNFKVNDQGTLDAQVWVGVVRAGWYKLGTADGWLSLGTDTAAMAMSVIHVAIALLALLKHATMKASLVRTS